MKSPDPSDSDIRSIAVVGPCAFEPCGAGAFARELCDAIPSAFEALTSFSVALGTPPHPLPHPGAAGNKYLACSPLGWSAAARHLNDSTADVVCLQHAWGAYHGLDDRDLLAFVHELRRPLVTTFHTVVENPTPAQLFVMKALIDLSERLVVKTQRDATLLQRLYDAPRMELDVIPHGIPDLSMGSQSVQKSGLDLAGKTVLLTYGSIGPGCGIESVIEALPAILEKRPEVVHVVLSTLPIIGADHGGGFHLNRLHTRATTNHVSHRVQFVCHGVGPEELAGYLVAADLCLAPCEAEDHTSSGALALMMGLGKVVISTPCARAEELLSQGRDIVVPPASPQAIASAVLRALDDGTHTLEISHKARAHSRGMLWPEVARHYLGACQKAVGEPFPSTDGSRAEPAAVGVAV